jgi:hypothetical protein
MRLEAIVIGTVLLGFPVQPQDPPASPQDPPPAAQDVGEGKLRPPGITPEIELSIQKGLQYLARTQGPEGSWRSAGSYGSYPVAMSALAGMALAGSGSTTTRGPYAVQIRRCVEYLVRCSMGNGLIASLHEEHRPMYGHGFATLFLAEIYGMEEDLTRQRTLHRVLKKAVELIASSQSAAGGWLYAPDDQGDEGSVTITQVQALRACRNSGVAVPIKVIQKAIKYVADCQNPDGGISYSLGSRGSSRAPITAAAVAVLYSAGKYDDPMAEKAVKYAQRTLPVSSGGGHHFYAHYYLAQALYQRGGPDWDKYFKQMADFLLRNQRPDGSWQGDGVGTTYGTAIALTILQLPYAILPIYQR